MKPKQTKLIRVTGPSITEKEVKYVAQAVRDGWHANHRKYVTEFENKFAKYVGRKYALATSSCTGALHLSFVALGLKKGDEVMVPNITWIATVAPLYWMGIRPIFTDIEPDTWCIDPADIERKITKKTKAIVTVDLYGNIANMRPILNIARRYKLKVIEDAAEAVGAEYYGKKAGSFGDTSCFSFQGSKAMVTGEGGMLLTDKKEIFEKAKHYNSYCVDKNKAFWNLEIGYQYKMSNLQAACGLAQLERASELLSKKRQIFSWYKKELAGVPGVTLNAERPRTKNSYWMVTAVLDKSYRIGKERLIKRLEQYNILARPFFYPLSSLPAIKVRANTPVSFDISPRAINLPCGQQVTEKEVIYVCDCLKKILNEAHRHE